MKIDDRLRHAFSNLENRVNSHLNDSVLRPVPEQRRMPRFLILAVAGALIVVAVGLAAWFGQGQPVVDPVVDQPTTTDEQHATTTTPGTTATTTPGTTATTTPGTTATTTPDTTAEGPTTSLPQEDSATSLPSVDDLVMLVAGQDGLFQIEDGEVSTRVYDGRALAVDAWGDVIAYETLDSDQIVMVRNGQTTEVVRGDDARYVTLDGVFLTGSGLKIAYWSTPKTDDPARRLRYLDIYDVESGDVSRLTESETQDRVNSYVDGLWIIASQSISNPLGDTNSLFGLDAGGTRVELDGAIPQDCFWTEPTCPKHPVLVDQPRVLVSVDWDGIEGNPVTLVVTDFATGEVLRTIDLDGMTNFDGFDVVWPYAVVGLDRAMLVDLTDGEVTELPVNGEVGVGPASVDTRRS